MPDTPPAALEFRGVEKQYGALRPLRMPALSIRSGRCTTLTGIDAAGAETFVNLATGASLPDKGEVFCFGQSTAAIPDSDAWLSFVERIGIVSERIVLLEAMTIAQNLALPFDLELDPVPAAVLPRVAALAAEVDIDPTTRDMPVAQVDATTRARIVLARAIALDPEMLLLEHPTARLAAEAVSSHAGLLKRICSGRKLTMVVLTLDEKLGKSLGGSVLKWDPASGQARERRGWF